MARKSSLDFALLFSFVVFSLIPFGPQVWFLIPCAVCIAYNSSSRWLRVLPWLSFFLGLYLLSDVVVAIAHLDLLAYCLLFLSGGVLVWTRREKRSFVSALACPFFAAFISALVLLLVDLKMTPGLTLSAWTQREAGALILPHFFQREAWLISKEVWSDWAIDFFDSVLAPILRDGVLGWFAAMMGFAYFINGTIETMIRSFRISQPKKRLRLWSEFNAWKSPEWVLIVLLAGLLLLSLEITFGHHQILALRVLGWTLSICALFPIFCQGICFASFLIPRASFLPFVLIFALLIINPVPILLLAGLADLWFDLRSRIGSNPEVQ